LGLSDKPSPISFGLTAELGPILGLASEESPITLGLALQPHPILLGPAMELNQWS